MHETFWQKENILEADGNFIHVIWKAREEKTPDGSDGQVYTAVCGREQTSWHDERIDPSPFFGTLKEAGAVKLPVCKKCVLGALRVFLAQRK